MKCDHLNGTTWPTRIIKPPPPKFIFIYRKAQINKLGFGETQNYQNVTQTLAELTQHRTLCLMGLYVNIKEDSKSRSSFIMQIISKTEFCNPNSTP